MTTEKNTPEESNSLVIIPESMPPIELFKPESIDPLLEEITKLARSHVPDISTEKGRKALKSLAFKIARSKTTLDDMGKELVSDWKAQAKKVDEVRAKVRDQLDDLKEEVLRPLTDWEAKESQRIARREEMLLHVQQAANETYKAPSAVTAAIEYIQKLPQDELYWEEFHLRASREMDAAIKKLTARRDELLEQERQREELAKLQAEKEAREKQEREDRIAKEAADKARMEAEQKAENDRRLAQEKADKEKREAEAARVKAENDKLDAERRAKEAEEREAQARIKAEKDKADAEAAATERERKRAEDERLAIARETEKRENDLRHKKKINNEIVDAMMKNNHFATREEAIEAVKSIAMGLIPKVKIQY